MISRPQFSGRNLQKKNLGPTLSCQVNEMSTFLAWHRTFVGFQHVWMWSTDEKLAQSWWLPSRHWMGLKGLVVLNWVFMSQKTAFFIPSQDLFWGGWRSWSGFQRWKSSPFGAPNDGTKNPWVFLVMFLRWTWTLQTLEPVSVVCSWHVVS